jgi:hypothetical protein
MIFPAPELDGREYLFEPDAKRMMKHASAMPAMRLLKRINDGSGKKTRKQGTTT